MDVAGSIWVLVEMAGMSPSFWGFGEVCVCGVVAERVFGMVGISLLCLLVQEVAVWCNA